MNPIRKLLTLVRPRPTDEAVEARAAERVTDLARDKQDVDRPKPPTARCATSAAGARTARDRLVQCIR